VAVKGSASIALREPRGVQKALASRLTFAIRIRESHTDARSIKQYCSKALLGRSPERSQAVPSVAEETSQEKPLVVSWNITW
jgi:hypothetical protein